MSRALRRMYRTAVSDKGLPENLSLTIGGESFSFHKVSWDIDGAERGLRYGTNPHQAAAIYVPDDTTRRFLADMRWVKWGKEGASLTNIEDGYRSLRIVNYFSRPAVAVMKHLNPTGVGIAYEDDDTLAEVFEKAWSGDPRAAYGSTIGFNESLDEDTAEAILRGRKYVECLFAPSYSSEALELLKKVRNLRVAEIPDLRELEEVLFPYEIKVLGNALFLEQAFTTSIRNLEDLKQRQVVTEREPDEYEMQNLLYAWWICCEKRSNGVVIWKKDKVLAVGTGQQDRIGAIEIALARANRAGHDLKGSTLASDGYMLWDNVDPLAEAGISAIIQPGGSVSDKRLIKQCNQYDISMIFTEERVFRHF